MIAAAVILAFAGQSDPLRAMLLADTSRPARRAIEAQAQFERERRSRLPSEPAGGGRCDERIGRFCYWYEEGDTAGPPEPEAVAARRALLLRTLAATATERPVNPWIAGQRVRYLLEQRAVDSALAVAVRCTTPGWWCAALTGFAFHAASRFAAADSAFDRALAEMPEDLRCFWSDWTMVLDEPEAGRFDRLDCREQIARADTLWLLAQPLLSRPGNDLRTEFLARRVMAALSSVAKSPYQIAWGKDLEEMMIRYGWSTGWSVADRPAASLDQPSVIGHQRSPAYRFWSAFDPDRPDNRVWELRPDRPRSRYAPVYADRMTAPRRFQIARFPRGDSTVVVGAIDPGSDTAFSGRALDLALAAARPGAKIAVVRRDSAATAPLLVRMAGAPLVTSLEASPFRGRVYQIARRYHPAAPTADGLTASDPLLFQVGVDLPETLEEAARAALPGLATSRAKPIGVYWEVHQPGTVDSVAISVTVSPARRGLLARLGEGLSLVNRRSSLTLQWRAAGGGPGVMGRAFELDLGRLPAGRYLLRLTADAGGRAATAERTIDLDP